MIRKHVNYSVSCQIWTSSLVLYSSYLIDHWSGAKIKDWPISLLPYSIRHNIQLYNLNKLFSPPSDTKEAYKLPAHAVVEDFPPYSINNTSCTIPIPYKNIPNIIKYPKEATRTTHDQPRSSSSMCDVIGVIAGTCYLSTWRHLQERKNIGKYVVWLTV